MSKTTVILVDDHRVVIEGIKSALKEKPEFEIIGEATDGSEAIKLVNAQKPDILILDISMPGLSGIQVVRKVKYTVPGIKIVIYTMHSAKEFVVDLFNAGISAYVLKDDPLSDLILSLKAVAGGDTYVSTMAPNILLRHMEKQEEMELSEDSYSSLSHREQEVFKYLAEGTSIKKIAEKLFISPKTVESHKYNIMEKLQVKSIVELTKIAIKRSLIDV
ncbi:MAG: response regulator transcription factor [Deltaproteobacteria bacterium]|nr:response regulator transcription factor [Deltaproteobacteria bacterium]